MPGQTDRTATAQNQTAVLAPLKCVPLCSQQTQRSLQQASPPTLAQRACDGVHLHQRSQQRPQKKKGLAVHCSSCRHGGGGGGGHGGCGVHWQPCFGAMRALQTLPCAAGKVIALHLASAWRAGAAQEGQLYAAVDVPIWWPRMSMMAMMAPPSAKLRHWRPHGQHAHSSCSAHLPPCKPYQPHCCHAAAPPPAPPAADAAVGCPCSCSRTAVLIAPAACAAAATAAVAEAEMTRACQAKGCLAQPCCWTGHVPR